MNNALFEGLYFLAPFIVAGTFHCLIVGLNLFPSLKIPLDRGRTYRGKRIFGSNKTLRGVLAIIAGTLFLSFIQFKLAAHPFFNQFTLIEYGKFNWFLHGAFLGIAYSAAELPNSFLKRQWEIPPGKTGRSFLLQYCIDQIDSVVGVLIAVYFLYHLSWEMIFILFFVGTILHIIFDYLLYVTGVKKWDLPESPFAGYVATFFQILIWFPIKVFTLFIFRGKIITNLSLSRDTQAQYILAANHQSRLDPFMVTGALPFRTLLKLFPFRYMTTNRYLSPPFSGRILMSLGAYPAFREEEKLAGLPYSEILLAKGHTVVIFPEGKIAPRKTSPAHKGVEVLAQIPNTLIIPISIEWQKRKLLRSVRICVGQAFSGAEMNAQEILERVYDLSLKEESIKEV